MAMGRLPMVAEPACAPPRAKGRVVYAASRFNRPDADSDTRESLQRVMGIEPTQLARSSAAKATSHVRVRLTCGGQACESGCPGRATQLPRSLQALPNEDCLDRAFAPHSWFEIVDSGVNLVSVCS